MRLAALTVLIIGNLLANQVHAEDVSTQPLTRIDCDKAEMAWDENANVCMSNSGNVSRQPLTRLNCENAGMGWNDTANVCGEASQAREVTSEAQIAQPTPPVSDVAAKQKSTEKPEALGTASGAMRAERLVVRTVANIHSGPSSKSALMGQAQQGAELDVAERDAGWVRFVDAATSRTGWIHEGLLTPLRSEPVPFTIKRPITAAAGKAAKPNAKVPRNGVRPAASHRAPKQRVGGRRSPSGYVQLPTGEEFRSNKRRFGSFARRRMLESGNGYRRCVAWSEGLCVQYR